MILPIILQFLFVSTLGTLFHFAYDWTNHNFIFSIIGATNESTWEHIKIALTPIFIWTLYDGAVYGLNPNYFVAKMLSIKELLVH